MTRTQELELRQAIYDILYREVDNIARGDMDMAVEDIGAAFAASKGTRAHASKTRPAAGAACKMLPRMGG